MTDDWMTPEHKVAALEGFLGNPAAMAYARAQSNDGSRRPVTGWEKLARACRRYLDAYQDDLADDISLGSVGNDLRIVAAREVSRARDLHLAEVEQDTATGRFRGRCSCGESLGSEWHQVSSVTTEWANHLAALSEGRRRP